MMTETEVIKAFSLGMLVWAILFLGVTYANAQKHGDFRNYCTKQGGYIVRDNDRLRCLRDGSLIVEKSING